MKAITFSYNQNTQVIRIPTEVKASLDKAKPGGIEMWKFSADVILIGLSVLETMRNSKEHENIINYQIPDLLLQPIQDLMARKNK